MTALLFDALLSLGELPCCCCCWTGVTPPAAAASGLLLLLLLLLLGVGVFGTSTGWG
jgi:hypothetical protein